MFNMMLKSQLKNSGRHKNEKRKLSDFEEESSPFCNELTSKLKAFNEHARHATALSASKSGLIIIGSVLLYFAPVRNYTIRHLQSIWIASGEFWQEQWNKLLDIIGEDPLKLWVYGNLLIFFSFYWIFGSIFTIMDVSNKWCFKSYKLRPGANEKVETKEILKVIRGVLFNQTVILAPIGKLLYWMIERRGFSEIRELPTFHRALLELTVDFLFLEIGFYYFHRIFHSKYVYKYFHRQHHEFTPTIAISALYAHPLEFCLIDIAPAAAGTMLMGSHIVTTWIFVGTITFSSLSLHSRSHLPICMPPEAHDFHHAKANECFGILGILDRLHGTNTSFRKTRDFDRSILLFSLVPIREAVPDIGTCEHKNEKQ